MVGKNNKQARWSKSANTFKRYSLKKLSVGVASVVIGTGVAWASSTTVHAAEEGTEVVTGDGEKEAPVESAVPTEAPVVGGDESSSHDAVADLVEKIKAAEEPASEAADAVEPRGASESPDNDYEPIPSDAIEGAAETSDEEKDAGEEDKINEERHTEEVSLEKEDKDNAEEKLDNEEFQGSFLRSAQPTRRRGRGGSTGTGENSGSTTATRNAEPEEPAVEILSASKLPQNPPVFYANEQRNNALNRDTGLNTVRTTGILAGTFFPEGTKFRLKDNRFTFADGANAQKEGGNEGQWNRTATIGWFGPSRSGVVGRETNPEKLLAPSIGKKATPFTPHPNNHPYVVRDTGQVLFGLGPSAVKGERINVPMVAEWKDPETGRIHQWEFLQGIQVGDPKVANPRQKPDNEKDWVFVGETPVESKRQSGNVKIGTRDNIVGQNFGWYGQKMGDIGEWIERKNVPKFRPTLADIAEDVEPQYKPVENGGTQSAQPSFVKQDDQSKTADKPNGTKFSLGNDAPEGAKINSDTGVVSFDQPVDKETTVPVKVTYSDGSSDNTNVVFKPAAPKSAEEVEPKYAKPADGAQTSGVPTFHKQGDENTPADKPEAGEGQDPTKFEITGDSPTGTTIDPTTGEVTLPNKPTEETTVNVQVTYPDGSTDTTSVTFTPEAQASKSAEEVEPKYAKPADGAQTSGVPTFHKQGDENTPADKPEAGEGQDPTKFEITGDSPTGTTIDPTTGEVTLPNKPTEETTVNVQVTYPDGSTDTTSVTFTPEAQASKSAEEVEPKYAKPADGAQTSGVPTFHKQGDENTPADKPEAGEGQDPTKFEITGDSPTGTTIDPTTGEVTLPNKPTEETTVNVQVTYPDGSTDTTSVTFTPEAQASKSAEEVEPKYAKPADGAQTSGVPTFHKQGDENTPADKPEAGEGQDPTKFEITGDSPTGTTIDPTTGEVTLPNKPTEETTVNVQVTYPDGSTDTTSVTFTPEAQASKSAEEVEPKYAKPADGAQTSGVPTFHKQGDENTPADKPEAGEGQDPTKFEITGDSPTGTTIDPTTGEVTLPNKPTEETTVNVQVTYPDGSTDTTSVTFTPEAQASKSAEEVEPKYAKPADGAQTSGVPTFHKQGDENTPADKPEAGEGQDPTKFEITGDSPTGTTIDPTTGEVTLPNKPTEETTVNVQVTYPDGSTDTTSVTFTPEAQASKSAEEVEPKYAKPADGAQTSGVPTFHKQGDENTPADKPEAGEGQDPTKFEITGDSPTGTTIDPTTGEVTLPNKPTEETTVNVQVTYPDGSTDTTSVTFTPEAQASKSAEEVEPKYAKPADGAQTSGVPTFHKQGDENTPADKPEAGEGQDPTKFEITGDSPTGTTIDPTTGEVALPNKPTEETTVNVQVTYPDGSTDTTSVTFTPEASTAPTISGYEDKTITEGRPIEPITPEITNKGEGDITENGLPDGLNINPETGEITGTPDVKDWKDNFDKEKPNSSDFEEERDFTVTVTVPGQPERTAEFTITVQRDTDGDGIADVNDPDSDGDGINDNVELERGTNPKDANDFKGPELSVNTPKKDEETVSGKTEPDTPVTVKDTDGKIIGQGVSDEEGNFKVPVERPLKGGEELDVTAGAPDNDKDQTTNRVTVDTPDNEEYEPKWEDTNAEDGKRVVVPNTGDEIPAGSTTTATITEDPNNKGKANWTVTVDDNGDVEVTPGSDAQPGDSATVTVETTYPDGTKDSSSFKVTVPTIQSFEYDPQGQDIEVPEGAEPNAADGIANKDELPEGTEFEFDGPVDTSTPGEKKAKVIVAYPDGSTDTVDVTVNVTEVPTQADNHEPKGKDIEVPEGAEPDAANGIANKDELPEGTEFEFDGPVDTSTPGKKKAKVIVAYPDGSTDTVDVTVNVTEVPTQADNHEPKGNPIFVEKNGTPNAADGIANKDELPEGTEFEFDGPVDTSTPGEKKAKVIVAYPDGSTDTVDVTVNVTDGDTPQSEIFEPQGQDIEVPEGGQPNAADGIANKDELPEGTEFEFDGPVDTSTPGKKKAKVIVAYPDGSTDTVDVTVNVTPKAPGKTTAETLEPKWNDSDAKDGGPVTVPNTGDKIPAGSKTTATITEDPNNKGKGNWTVTVGEDGSVTVTPGADAQPGDSATVTVETTYPDGSKDSSSFKVTVPAVGPTHAHGDSLVHDKPSYDLDKLGHGQTQPSRPAEDKGQGQVQDKAQTPDVDKAGLPNYVPSQSGERLPDTATGAWVLGVVGLMSTGLGSALGLKRKKEDEE
ncbi:YSIRK-type signal peptide-containing protein [Dolosigranulum pigrum]|uniref:Rib/alpha-like domain-containing protein n=1 Tax=Dolosigranulum pigrum TaxID=29394 RepID=UPI001AD8666C|nr:Rib/alpha-like domain-containing protein [Dolosigranulum pigrum]QTJ43704.1 YSIRK-type signal peptide-containing protein [Dolosigranulum pigrum]